MWGACFHSCCIEQTLQMDAISTCFDQIVFLYNTRENHSTCQAACTLDNVLNFLLNGNICNNSNWMSITIQSISLSVSFSILSSLAHLCQCQVVNPMSTVAQGVFGPGWWMGLGGLVPRKHILRVSWERCSACVCQPLPPTHIHTCSSVIKSLDPFIHLLTTDVSSLDPDGWSSDPTVTERRRRDSRFFSPLQMANLTHVLHIITFSCEGLTPCSFNKPVKLTVPAHPKGNM